MRRAGSSCADTRMRRCSLAAGGRGTEARRAPPSTMPRSRQVAQQVACLAMARGGLVDVRGLLLVKAHPDHIIVVRKHSRACWLAIGGGLGQLAAAGLAPRSGARSRSCAHLPRCSSMPPLRPESYRSPGGRGPASRSGLTEDCNPLKLPAQRRFGRTAPRHVRDGRACNPQPASTRIAAVMMS